MKSGPKDSDTGEVKADERGHDLNMSKGVHMCQDLRQASNTGLEACSSVSIQSQSSGAGRPRCGLHFRHRDQCVPENTKERKFLPIEDQNAEGKKIKLSGLEKNLRVSTFTPHVPLRTLWSVPPDASVAELCLETSVKVCFSLLPHPIYSHLDVCGQNQLRKIIAHYFKELR